MKQLKISFVILIIISFITGFLYPLMITGLAQLALPIKANGSLVTLDERITGSELIGQQFTSPKYFHGRPSANNYDGGNSGGSNLGPTNKKLIDRAAKMAELVRKENGLSANAKVPADLVLASGSGLDPHISIEAAVLQVPRIARERKMDSSIVIDLIRGISEKQYFGIFGNSFVNVLKLNLSLDALGLSK
jgi:potassium-transporting ATPase KdpC subunit